MKNIEIIKIIVLGFLVLVMASCTYDKADPSYGDYPHEVGKIIINKCATAGCHDNISKEAASGLSLETWNDLFSGSRGGAVVIPYRSDFSTFIYYTNTYSDMDSIQLAPTMPFGKDRLSRDEMKTLINWIQQGAPDANNYVKFSDNPYRKKVYVGNRGCDVVTVFDAKSMLAMRYIDVGISAYTESPQMIKVSPDNQYWYVIFQASSVIQKFRTSDDGFVSQISIGSGIWSSFTISEDSKKAFVIDAQPSGKIVSVDLENMQLIDEFNGNGEIKNPYGCIVNKNFTTLYVASSRGNYIDKIDISDPLNPLITKISLEAGQPINYSSSLDPQAIIFSPDESTYFVSCKKTSELIVMQTSNDSLLATIPLGHSPSQMTISNTFPYLFVNCMGSTDVSKKSSVFVIDYNTHSVVASLYAGHESYGIAVDDVNKKVFVSNRNVSAGGPAAHHASVCAGKNGYITAIDMNTLQLVPGYKAEVSVDPYSVGIMH